jgi:hypothetical protein
MAEAGVPVTARPVAGAGGPQAGAERAADGQRGRKPRAHRGQQITGWASAPRWRSAGGLPAAGQAQPGPGARPARRWRPALVKVKGRARHRRSRAGRARPVTAQPGHDRPGPLARPACGHGRRK